MEFEMIYWKDALKLMISNSTLEQKQIDFNQEMIPVSQVIIFNQHGYRVPEELVEYDDVSIDYSDLPALNKEDILSGKLERIYTAEIPLNEEVVKWLNDSKINLNTLVGELVNNFYNTMKHIKNNAAL